MDFKIKFNNRDFVIDAESVVQALIRIIDLEPGDSESAEFSINEQVP